MCWKIANCPSYFESINDKTKPCHQIVNLHLERVIHVETNEPDFERLPRPIPWIGDIDKELILFLHCSPNSHNYPNYPMWHSSDWIKEQVISFNYRETLDSTNELLPLNGLDESNEIDKETREISRNSNGMKSINKFANNMTQQILGEYQGSNVSEDRFSIVNLVRCPSSSKRAILKATNYCSSNWLIPTLEASSAKIVFVLGQKPAAVLCSTFPDQVPQDWGQFAEGPQGYGKGFWPRSKGDLQEVLNSGHWNLDSQLKNTFCLNFGDRMILFVFYSTPGSGILWSIKDHPELVSEELIAYWRSFVLEEN